METRSHFEPHRTKANKVVYKHCKFDYYVATDSLAHTFRPRCVLQHGCKFLRFCWSDIVLFFGCYNSLIKFDRVTSGHLLATYSFIKSLGDFSKSVLLTHRIKWVGFSRLTVWVSGPRARLERSEILPSLDRYLERFYLNHMSRLHGKFESCSKWSDYESCTEYSTTRLFANSAEKVCSHLPNLLDRPDPSKMASHMLTASQTTSFLLSRKMDFVRCFHTWSSWSVS